MVCASCDVCDALTIFGPNRSIDTSLTQSEQTEEMETINNLRRTQSLKNVASVPWRELGLPDRRKSVSQLVAEYQDIVNGHAKAAQGSKLHVVDTKQKLRLQFANISVTETTANLETLVQLNDSIDGTNWANNSANSRLTRSKSMEILPRQRTLSASSLKERFETKDSTPQKLKGILKKPSTPVKEDANCNGRSVDLLVDLLGHTEPDGVNYDETLVTPAKEEIATSRVERTLRTQRSKTVAGVVYTDKIPSPDDKRRSIADFRDSSSLYGREKSPISVKAMSAIYLSKVAAADTPGNLLKPVSTCFCSTAAFGDPKIRNKIHSLQPDKELASIQQKSLSKAEPFKVKLKGPTEAAWRNQFERTAFRFVVQSLNVPLKMADVSQKAPEQLDASYCKDDSAQSDLAVPVLPPSSSADSQSPISAPPSKEAISMLYEQRQKCELRRLLKHTCPELKGMGNRMEEELAHMLNSDLTDIAHQGEVQSRRWIFENGAVNSSECQHKQAHLIERPNEGGHALEKEFKEEVTEGEALTQEENFRVDVKATRKMFEGQFIESVEDGISRRVIISEDEKGAVQKQKREFETSQTYHDPAKRNNPFSISDITDVDQDGSEVYLGISRAKEIFETGFEKENVSMANGNPSSEDKSLKTNVRDRAQMFESTPLDRINDTTEDSMSKTLASLKSFNVIHAHGILVEASEVGHVRKANYNFTENKDPEIQHEEMVMGSIKGILLQLLAKANLNPLIAFLKEDDQGNVNVTNLDVPTHQLPFTVNQDKEYRTASMVQVIEDLLGQETRLGKGLLIQENVSGSVETLVYALYRQESHDESMTHMMACRETNLLTSRTGDTTPNMSSPPPFIQGDASSLSGLENRTSNVKLFRNCIEKGELDYLKSLQKSQSDEDLSVRSTDSEQNMIAPSNFKSIKAMFTTNPGNSGSARPSEKPVQKENRSSKLSSREDITENVNVETGEDLPYQDAKQTVGVGFLTEVVDAGEDKSSNVEEAIKSLQQATTEAKALERSVQEEQHDTLPSPPDDQYLTEIMGEAYISETESTQHSEAEQELKEREECLKGSTQAALDSLGRSSFNVTKGDFKAAMIYRNSAKPGNKKPTNVQSPVKQSADAIETIDDKAGPLSFSGQVAVETQREKARQCQGQPTNKPVACPNQMNQTDPLRNKKPLGPKPAIPPKPDHLKSISSSNTVTIKCATDTMDVSQTQAEINSAEPMPDVIPQSTDVEQTQLCCVSPITENKTDNQLNQGFITISTATEKKDSMHEESERNPPETLIGSGIESQASLQNFGMKSGQAIPPVKPKRIKMATERATQQNTDNTNSTPSNEEQSKSKVTMREKKGRRESEAERRQRLSVHMDEIMRGNVNAAMEIFDKLRKQEELKTILSKVEEIEGETSQGQVGDLRRIIESVPDWAAPQMHVHPKKTEVEKKVETVAECEMLSSMQVAFGDLEKASAAIITLKEQTLSRLMEIEETIKKALYSVSTLKSDSDIAGLSGLFKESMIAGQYVPISGNIRKISIGSSKSPKSQSLNNQHVTGTRANAELAVQGEKSELCPPAAKSRAGSPSSPSFISIQSTSRKNQEKTQTSTVALTCSDTSPANEKRQVSTLEVKTGAKAETVIGTKIIREKYEETDSFGNSFYSTKTSTVVTTQPETTCFRSQMMSSPATLEISDMSKSQHTFH